MKKIKILQVLLLLPLIIGGAILYSQNISKNVLGIQDQTHPTPPQKDTLESEYLYWLSVVHDHPDYRDGFFRLATIAYQRGDLEKLREFLGNVRSLDPNFSGLQQLEALIQTK